MLLALDIEGHFMSYIINQITTIKNDVVDELSDMRCKFS